MMPATRPFHVINSVTSNRVVGTAAIMLVTSLAPFASASEHRLNRSEAALFKLISHDPGQQRNHLILDPILCKVAHQTAKNMAQNSYFSHVDLRGRGPNRRAKQTGYLLPSWYDMTRTGNNIESIVMAGSDPQAALDVWKNSLPHRVHVLGTLPFYRDQESVGVGSFTTGGSGSRTYYVFLSAPENLSKRPPMVTLKNPAGRKISATR